MPGIISEFLAMGMPLQKVIESLTWNPAKEIHHEELGNMSVGAVADIAVIKLISDRVYFYDHSGNSIKGSSKFKAVFTIKNGETVYKSFIENHRR